MAVEGWSSSSSSYKRLLSSGSSCGSSSENRNSGECGVEATDMEAAVAVAVPAVAALSAFITSSCSISFSSRSKDTQQLRNCRRSVLPFLVLASVNAANEQSFALDA